MERRRIFIDEIHIGKRHREPDAAKVKEIAKSISELGLMNPPAVCLRDDIVTEDGEICDGVAVLIYGRHRLAALKLNGEEYVECLVHDVDDLHAELMEIDENLARAELSPAQEAAHILRRKEIWTEMNSVRNSDETPKAVGRPKAFESELADISKSSRSVAFQKTKRAEELGPDIHRIAGTSLDKGVEMDALIKLPEPERKSLIDRASKGETVSARPPAPPKPLAADKALEVMATDIIESADQPATFADIKRVWDRAERADQEAFLKWAHKNIKSAAQDDFDPAKLWLAHG